MWTAVHDSERINRLRQRHRSPEQMTLTLVAFVVDQKLPLIGRFHTLRDNADSQPLSHCDDREHDGDVVFFVRKAADEYSIDLQCSYREALELRERRVAGPEIIDGDANASPFETLHNLDGLVNVAGDRGFG